MVVFNTFKCNTLFYQQMAANHHSHITNTQYKK